ncbi:MAG: lipopolysaccharide biosynthesis protein [Arcobacter sp.]|nr:MAG: lipopolysaccharide biosynthesis protein [Arcobacter sp.]
MAVTKEPTAIICLSPYSGGMEIDSIKMAKKIAPFSKTVIIAKANHFITKEMQKQNEIVLETISFKSNLGPSLIFGIRALVKKYKIKNVIFFGASELKSMYFSFLGLDINLIIRHGTTKSRPKKDWFHRLIYSKVNYHVAICEHLAKNVKYIIPFGKKTQLKTIYSSIIISKEPEPRNFNPPIKILNVSRIAEGKGHQDIIKACEVLYENKIDFYLTLVGDGEEEYINSIKKLASNTSYNKKITFTGRSNNIPSHLNKNDIFLFPSAGEGLSNSFIEALSYGLVSIAYDNTSFQEFKEMGFYYHLAKDQNIQSLKSILLTISINIQNEKRLAHQNIDISSEQFNAELEIKAYLKLLQ